MLHATLSLVFFFFANVIVLLFVVVCRDKCSGDDTLQKCGISEQSTVFFALSSFSEDISDEETFYINNVVPSVTQTLKGISVLLSSLYAIVSCGFVLIV